MAIPLLVEGGGSRERVDRVLVVDVDEELQLQRVQARDGMLARAGPRDSGVAGEPRRAAWPRRTTCC